MTEATMQGAPSLSIVIPAYNASQEIASTILNAMEIDPLEIIVVDDGSNDETASVASSFPCRVIRQHNQGASVARRTGIAASVGQLVILLDADDRLIASNAKKVVEHAARLRTSWSVCGSRYRIKRVNGTSVPGPPVRERYSTQDLIDECSSPWPPAASVMNGPLLRASIAPNRTTNPRFAEDYELLLEMSTEAGIHAVDVEMLVYNPSGGKSAQSAALAVRTAEDVRLAFAHRYGFPARGRNSRQLRAVALQRMIGDRIGSGRYLSAAGLTSLRLAIAPLSSTRSIAAVLGRRVPLLRRM